MSKSIAYHTLGCKLNFSETSSIARQLQADGYRKVDFTEKPDIFLINTCSVTENANRECRAIVNKALTVNPEALVIITGCYAQLKPEEISNIPGVDLVLGANEKFNVSNHLAEIPFKGKAIIKACEISDVNSFVSTYSTGDRTRVFLKVQDGCDYNCSFCTIPLARGKSRSNSVEKVLKEVNEILNSGAKEIVLTGINLGDYGITADGSGKRSSSFYELAKALDESEEPARIRISSIEPNLLDNRIIQLVANSEKFVPHFHIPLQSGSDKILRKMRRRYLTALYTERILTIKSHMPHCCIGADVITGFPGETEADFLETYNFLQEADISYLHVFSYSVRENTLAAEMEEQIPMGVRKERTRMLRILSEKKLRNFYQQHLGKTLPVLFEADHKNGWMHGFTPNYIKVKTPYDRSLVNQIRDCYLDEIDANGEVYAKILEPSLAGV